MLMSYYDPAKRKTVVNMDFEDIGQLTAETGYILAKAFEKLQEEFPDDEARELYTVLAQLPLMSREEQDAIARELVGGMN